jgi:hypothetical protein
MRFIFVVLFTSALTACAFAPLDASSSGNESAASALGADGGILGEAPAPPGHYSCHDIGDDGNCQWSNVQDKPCDEYSDDPSPILAGPCPQENLIGCCLIVTEATGIAQAACFYLPAIATNPTGLAICPVDNGGVVSETWQTP